MDVEPGDREAECGGLMEPVSCERACPARKGNAWVLTHRCIACGHTKRNKMSPQDSFDTVVNIV